MRWPIAGEPAESTFQKGVQVYQSGHQAAALQLLIDAAKSGNSKAATQAGWCYEFGQGARRDFAEAARWYRLAAEMGSSRAQKNLGALYETNMPNQHAQPSHRGV